MWCKMIHNEFHCSTLNSPKWCFFTMPNNAPGLCIFSTFTFLNEKIQKQKQTLQI